MTLINTFMSWLLSLVFAVCTTGLVLGATYAFRRNCEDFGCPNSAIFWSIWIGVYLIAGASGLGLRKAQKPGTRSRVITTVCLALLAALGAALAGYWWLIHDAA